MSKALRQLFSLTEADVTSKSVAHPDQIAKGQGYDPEFRSGAYRPTPAAYPTSVAHPDQLAKGDPNLNKQNPLNTPRYTDQLPPGNLGNFKPQQNPLMHPDKDPLSPEDLNTTGNALTNPNRVDAQGAAAIASVESGAFYQFLQNHPWAQSIWQRIAPLGDSIAAKFQGKGMVVGGALVGSAVAGLGLWYIWKKLKAKIDAKKNGMTEETANAIDDRIEESQAYLYAYCKSLSAILEEDESLGVKVAANQSSIKSLVNKAVNYLKDIKEDIKSKYSDDKDAKDLLSVVEPMQQKLETAQKQNTQGE